MHARYVYPGTNIPLVRGGAPVEGGAGGGASATAGGDAGKGTPDAGGKGADAGKGDAGGGQRDWQKDYTELEARHKATETERDNYKKFGTPEQIENAIAWARWGIETKAKHDRGEYVSKADLDKARRVSEPAAPADPYGEDFDERPAADRARIMGDQIMERMRKELVEPITAQLTQRQQQELNQLNLAMQLVPYVAKDPTLDTEQLMAEALQRASEMNQPGKLLGLVMKDRLAPMERQKAIDDAVKAAVEAERAKATQERENEQIQQFSTFSTPNLVRRPVKERGAALGEARQRFMQRINKITRSA